MKIALIQMKSLWEEKAANLKRAESFVKQAEEEACDVVVFPEMFPSGFSRNVDVIAEGDHDETAAFLAHAAKRSHLYIIAGYAEKAELEGKGRNIAVAYNREGKRLCTYTKIHPFSYAREEQFYLPGNRLVQFEIDGMPASLFICYDLRFPEIFRVVAKEVSAMFIIANWPSARKTHWETLLRARAIENQCFVIGVNRIGTDGCNLTYPGCSHVFDPLGNDLCAGDDQEEFLTAEFPPEEVATIRASFPVLHDMHEVHLDILRENESLTTCGVNT